VIIRTSRRNGPSEVIKVELGLVTSWYVSIKGYIIWKIRGF